MVNYKRNKPLPAEFIAIWMERKLGAYMFSHKAINNFSNANFKRKHSDDLLDHVGHFNAYFHNLTTRELRRERQLTRERLSTEHTSSEMSSAQELNARDDSAAADEASEQYQRIFIKAPAAAAVACMLR